MLDFDDQVLDAAKTPPSDRLLGDNVEPDFHLVEPGGIAGSVMNMIAGSKCQPASDFGLFVSSVVVDDQMNIQILRDITLDVLQKAEKLLMPVTRLTAGQNFSGGQV